MTNPDDFADTVREMRDAATPGPWKRDGSLLLRVDGFPFVIGEMFENGGSNATFIAALPDIADAFLQRDEECKRLEAGLSEKTLDYLRRLIAGVRKQAALDPETIEAIKGCGDEVTISRWVDAKLLCLVIEREILKVAPNDKEN